MVRLEDNC